MATDPVDDAAVSPGATVTHIGVGFLQEFDRRLHELAKGVTDPDLKDNLDAQAEAAVTVWRLFHRGHAVPPQRRSWVLETFPALFTRCREHPRPADLLAAILDLDREEEVRRAVWTREAQFEGYRYLPGEDIYPTTGWLGDYLQYARQNSVPLAFHFWSGVTVFGAACKRMVYSDCGSFEVRMPWYTVLAGLPAVGKGAAMHPAVDILLRLNRMIGDSPDTRGHVVNMIPEDVTPESFIENLADITGWRHTDVETAEGTTKRVTEVFPVDATAFLALDELATFFGSDTWAARKRVPFMVTIKEKDEYTKGTRKDGRVHLKNLGISMLGCCAPGWVKEALTRDVTEGGLLDRMVFVYRDPAWVRKYQYSLLNIPPLDPLRANMLARELLPIAQLPHRLVCHFTPDARQFVHNAHQQQVAAEQQRFETEDPGEAMSSNRMGTTLLRLAMVLSISERGITNGAHITQAHCELAQRILDAEASSLQTFLELAQRSPESSTSARIAQWVAKRGGCASLSEITQKFKKVLGTSRVIREHLATCTDEGSLVRMSVGAKTVYRTAGHALCLRCSA